MHAPESRLASNHDVGARLGGGDMETDPVREGRRSRRWPWYAGIAAGRFGIADSCCRGAQCLGHALTPPTTPPLPSPHLVHHLAEPEADEASETLETTRRVSMITLTLTMDPTPDQLADVGHRPFARKGEWGGEGRRTAMRTRVLPQELWCGKDGRKRWRDDSQNICSRVYTPTPHP